MYSIYLILLYLVLIALKPTRKLTLALTPWFLFACSYDWMRLCPNYMVNPIDVSGLYETEKSLFGITTATGVLAPCEYFAIHHCAVADFLAGVFYLCWVPVPIAFSLYLYIKGDKRNYLRLSVCWVLVNFMGFIGYYIHPAAPPWYAMQYGMTPILNTPSNVAGLSRFDALIGLPIFHSIYGNSSNVFAAVPSLHATYMLITTFYAAVSRQRKWLVGLFAVICMGIWWTAVYAGHHYIIDVTLGILTAVIGITLFERVLLRLPKVSKWMQQYVSAI